ncbi:ATP-binding protein [Streptomyces sp. NPDC054849]
MSDAAHALLRRLAALRAVATELVARRSADDPAAHDPLRGLYVSQETALRAGSGNGTGDVPLAWDAPEPGEAGEPGEPREPGESAWPQPPAGGESGPGGGEPVAGATTGPAGDAPDTGGAANRLGAFVRDFGLSALDLRILLAALAPDVDRRFEPLYGYLNDDVGRRRATVALALELAGSGPHLPQARGRFHASAPLIAGGLLELEDEARPLPGRALRVPERVVAHLLGDDRLDEELCRRGVTLLRPTPDTRVPAPLPAPAPADPPDPAALLARSRRPVTVHLREKRGGDSAASVVTALRAAGRTVLLYRPRAQDLRIGPLLRREARLRGAGTAVVVTALPEDPGGLISSVAAPDVTSVFAGHEPCDPDWTAGVAGVSLLALEASATGSASGAGASADRWRAELPGFEGDVADAVASYRLGGEQIAAVARTARELAALEGVALDARHVRLTARRLSAPLLGRHARQVRPAVGFADLVMPESPRSQLVELVGRARHRDVVLGDWRLRTGGGRGRGVVALFAGESGTGKTLAAEVVAGELGLDLYVVDLSSVVDKYVGETEKNLERIFSEADRTDAVLLFDEADAVFGKRSRVQGGNDRYANLESAYLLQRLESFDGIAVLTTNLRANVDEAFTRRLDLVVDFPFPDAELRARLWRQALAGAPTEPGIEAGLERCAAQFELAGGSIRSAALTACYAARVRGDGPVTADDVRDGARREYVKAGRLVPGNADAWAP